MAGKLEGIGIDFIDDNQCLIADVQMKDRRLVGVKVTQFDFRQDSKTVAECIKKHPGKAALVCPVVDAYFYELSVPQSASWKEVLRNLELNSEISFPKSSNGNLRLALQLHGDLRQKRFTQLMIPDHKMKLEKEVELQEVDMNPSSVFQGMSEIFQFPANMLCLAVIVGPRGTQIVWGKNGELYGMRAIGSLRWTDDVLPQTLQASNNAERFYTWCDREDQFEIEKTMRQLVTRHLSRISWIHLKGTLDALKGKEEGMSAVCAAVANILHHKNECRLLRAPGKTLMNDQNFKNGLMKLLVLAMFVFLAVDGIILHKIKIKSNLLRQIKLAREKAFYTVFSEKTAVISPVDQIKAKMREQGGVSQDKGLTPYDFQRLVSDFQDKKPQGINILTVAFENGSFKFYGNASAQSDLKEWVRVLETNRGYRVKLEPGVISEDKSKNSFILTVNEFGVEV